MGNIRFINPRIEDFDKVQSVFKNVWDINILKDMYIKHINSEEYSIICAVKNKEIVGVVSGFTSISLDEKKRWEVDLLAVKKEHQGKGIGTLLVKESLKVGEKQGVDFARALVAIDNYGSQNAFKKSNFQKDKYIYNLQLWKPEEIKTYIKKDEKIKYLQMDTLSYRGLWIENLFYVDMNEQRFKEAILYAQQKAFNDKRHNTGATIKEEDMSKIPEKIFKESTCNGKYNWWYYRYNK